MISHEFGEKFSLHWIDAWNRHDLDMILSHYSENFEMSSPYIPQIAGEASGKLKGKATIRAYWSAALQRMPNLSFKLLQTLIGIDSVTIYYHGTRGMAAEVFFFNDEGLVIKAVAHYE